MNLQQVTHSFEPIFNAESRVLLLGTMPSPKSREQGFYYGHPRNRFWKVLSTVLDETYPENKEEKIAMCLRNHIAIWDVLKSCEIKGAADSSIQHAVPNDLCRILNHADIQAIFATGQKAAQLYRKYCYPVTGKEIIVLPSTSPANCRLKDTELLERYMVIKEYLLSI